MFDLVNPGIAISNVSSVTIGFPTPTKLLGKDFLLPKIENSVRCVKIIEHRCFF